MTTIFDFSTMIEGNNAPVAPAVLPPKMEPAKVQAIPNRHKPAQLSPSELLAFANGFAWLRLRLPDLIMAGWTHPELFRRNRARRGIAWLSLWADKDATADLTAEGFIRFTIIRGERVCIQQARPITRYRDFNAV